MLDESEGGPPKRPKDDRCHICRRVPAEQDQRYWVTTCLDCDATRGVVRARKPAKTPDHRGDAMRAVWLHALDQGMAVPVAYVAVACAYIAAAEGNGLAAIGAVACAWAAHALLYPRAP